MKSPMINKLNKMNTPKLLTFSNVKILLGCSLFLIVINFTFKLLNSLTLIDYILSKI